MHGPVAYWNGLMCNLKCSIDLRPAGPKRQMRRLLKKEVSLDTYTWQKKYGHLTSSVMMAQVDERLKRRFSVSASMEEISKIAERKTLSSQANIGPEQAALAQSQHFDQLEALWNKRSPPRRRHNAVSAPGPVHVHAMEFILEIFSFHFTVFSVAAVVTCGRSHQWFGRRRIPRGAHGWMLNYYYTAFE